MVRGAFLSGRRSISAGKPLSKMKEYRSAFDAGRAYKAGDLVMYGEEIKKAVTDVSAGAAFNPADRETAWSPYRERDRGLFSKFMNGYAETVPDPDRTARFMFDETGLKHGGGYAWREPIRMRNSAQNDYLARRTRRLGVVYGEKGLLKKLKIQDRDFMTRTFKAGRLRRFQKRPAERGKAAADCREARCGKPCKTAGGCGPGNV
jgi:hypothetical protein